MNAARNNTVRRPMPERRGGFHAETADGSLGLVIETGAPGCAAEAAVRLAEAEPILSALEDWLGLVLDWRWDESSAVCHSSAEPAAHWIGGGMPLSIRLPWALLRRSSAPPPVLNASLQWEPVPALCTLATLDLSPADAALLEPGSALLLPASFEPAWIVELRAGAEAPGQGLAVVLGRPDRPEWTPAGRERAVGGEWEVRCAVSAPVDVAMLAGWRAPDAHLRLAVDAGFDLWQLSRDEAPRHRARGRLLPWGLGHALWLSAD